MIRAHVETHSTLSPVHATYDGVTLEVGSGGIVDWMQQLLANREERLVTSGLGLDRMAAYLPGDAPGGQNTANARDTVQMVVAGNLVCTGVRGGR